MPRPVDPERRARAVTISLPADLIDAIQRMSGDRTLSGKVREALEWYYSVKRRRDYDTANKHECKCGKYYA